MSRGDSLKKIEKTLEWLRTQPSTIYTRYRIFSLESLKSKIQALNPPEE